MTKSRLRTRRQRKAGAILVWFALVLPLLLGMTGLVIDGGLLMASHRHLQNSVDAASMAAAKDLLNELSETEARNTATNFVLTHHDLGNADVEIHIPPANGVYTGEPGFVEVMAEYETPTIFMQLLDGSHTTRVATARAVAGGEENQILDGIIALDHRKTPGLTVTGNAQLTASGRIIVNSEGGGLSVDGTRITDAEPGFGAFVSPFAGVTADEVYLVGGANRVDRFQDIDGSGDSPLKTEQLPISDPLANLATPTVANGVLNVRRGAASATPTEMTITNQDESVGQQNLIVTNATTGEQTMILHPGIYTSIDVTGGNVIFRPGIYVMAAPREAEYAVRILDGEIEADGIMFYNTNESYDPVTGQPDLSDGGQLPEATGEAQGQIRINAALGFSGIDTMQHDYSNVPLQISQFNGLLVYQRRSKIANVQIQGFVEDETFEGAIYAKWASLRLPAGGVLNSQIVVGTIAIPGHGDLHVQYDTEDVLRSIEVYLVE